MSKIKSFSVGNGDMFYIKHNSDNFTTIDCCLTDDVKEEIQKDAASYIKDQLKKAFKGNKNIKIK